MFWVTRSYLKNGSDLKVFFDLPKQNVLAVLEFRNVQLVSSHFFSTKVVCVLQALGKKSMSEKVDSGKRLFVQALRISGRVGY